MESKAIESDCRHSWHQTRKQRYVQNGKVDKIDIGLGHTIDYVHGYWVWEKFRCLKCNAEHTCVHSLSPHCYCITCGRSNKDPDVHGGCYDRNPDKILIFECHPCTNVRYALQDKIKGKRSSFEIDKKHVKLIIKYQKQNKKLMLK